MLPDEKHDRTFRIKAREVLLDEKHDRTFGIKYCQTKGTTKLLELSITRRKVRLDFEIKYCQIKNTTRLLELSVVRRKA
ncbi:hypothetical protein RclHR1_21740002 [Rhizophagus clarus]|uniref:Uncharacterized protein n=1 Tax=Rhizophagus clarus TaxID=94130 RepID=A0A2Z6QV27_9GLOM|nr:hypothetical protein RclHR1_21740002 [Rhizophagus clarus]